MRINVSSIKGKLGEFLRFLRDEYIENIVVIGGALRNYFLKLPIRDIDIAVKINSPAPYKKLSYQYYPNGYRILPVMKKAIYAICESLDVELVDFEKSRVKFGTTPLELMGLRPVRDTSGKIVLPDVFVEKKRKVVYNFVPLSITINQIAIDATGRVYVASPHTFGDLNKKIARFVHQPTFPLFITVVRLFDYINRFNLVLEPKSQKYLKSYLLLLKLNKQRWIKELADTEVLKYLNKILPSYRLPTRWSEQEAQRLLNKIIDTYEL